MSQITFLLIALIVSSISPETTESVNKDYVLDSINQIREEGCYCGNTYYPPVAPLSWNDLLYKSAYNHARSMSDMRYFAHISPDGKDVGDRLDDIGYYWQYAGENLAEGQKTYDEVMKDWLKSKTHCKMIMNPNMQEVGVARYKSYWVQHFGRKMPVRAKRVNRRYKEGE